MRKNAVSARSQLEPVGDDCQSWISCAKLLCAVASAKKGDRRRRRARVQRQQKPKVPPGIEPGSSVRCKVQSKTDVLADGRRNHVGF